MTVIAWDGKTLAADKRCVISGGISVVTKIYKINGNLVATADTLSVGKQLLEWVKNGCIISDYPELQKHEDLWSPLVIITPEKKILRYERTPYPFEIEQRFYAFGSGRDYAMAAMHLGRNALQAVEVACIFDAGCGNGTDTLTLGAGING